MYQDKNISFENNDDKQFYAFRTTNKQFLERKNKKKTLFTILSSICK